MEKSKIKTIAITVIWILAAIGGGLLFAAFFQGCYAGEDQYNWIEIEDAGVEYEIGNSPEFETINAVPIIPPMLPACDQLAITLAPNKCDFCPLMTTMCPGWLDDHTGADGQIRIGNTVIAEYNCAEYENEC